MRILLIEDDDVLRDIVSSSLRSAGHLVDPADTVERGDHLWRVQPFDAVLLDLHLPDGSGLAALRAARARKDTTPVLVLTAHNRTDERIAGLDAGADDYLGKPFDLREIEARLRALVRRARHVEDDAAVGLLMLQRATGRFFTRDAQGAAVPLTLPAREHSLLVELMSPPGRVVSKRELSDKLSSFEEALTDNALEAFISRLRKKLTGTGAHIRTLRGLGYALEDEAAHETVPR
jgi:two-component system OmpR family response regulator